MDIIQIDTFFRRHRVFAIIALLFIAGVIPFASGLIVNHFFPNWEWDYITFHSFVEGFGSLMSITIAVFILVRIDEKNRNYMLPLACAMLAMGILGFILESNRVPLGPVVLGIILGGRLEHSFIQCLAKSDSYLDFFTRPVAAILGLLLIGLWLYPLLAWIWRRK